MTHPLWSRLDRFENYQVRTLRKHDKWKGRRVILGGTRIRYPGRAGASWKIETSLAYFGMSFTAQFFMGLDWKLIYFWLASLKQELIETLTIYVQKTVAKY